jgi:PKD repeat protein
MVRRVVDGTAKGGRKAGRGRALDAATCFALLGIALLFVFTSSARAAEDGEITGKVTAAASKAAIAGIEVCAAEDVYEVELFGHCAKTNSSGEYSISSLSPGRYGIGFFAPDGSGLNYIPQYYQGQSYTFEAELLSVEAGKTVSGIDAALQVGGEITGKVTGASSKAPIVGIEVCASGELDRQCATTSSGGEYTLPGLAAGSYEVSFTAPEGRGLNFVTQYYNEKPAYSSFNPVTVEVGQTSSGIDATLQTGGQVTGKVTSASTKATLSGIEVCATSEVSGERCAETGAEGEYTVSGLVSGSYTVAFYVPDGLNYLTQFYNHKSTSHEAEVVSVTEGATTLGVNATMAVGGEIAGTVTDATTKADVADVEACPVTRSGGYAGECATTSSSGAYTIMGLESGEYTVVFYPGVGQNYITQYYEDKPTSSEADGVSVTAGAATSGVDAAMLPAGEITGKVTAASSKAPLGGIEACPLTVGGGYEGPCATTNSGGEYAIVGLVTGEYKVEFYSTATLRYVTQFYDAEPASSQAKPIAVTAGSTASGIDAALVLGGQITGKVTGASGGTSLSDIEISVYEANGEQFIASTTTDAAGEYTVSGLGGGEYKLEFVPDYGGGNYLPQFYSDQPSLTAANPIKVAVEQTSSGIDAQLQTGGEITGKVTDASSKAALTDINVCVQASSGEGVYQCATSNSAGEYTVVGLATGKYKVEFEATEGANYLSQYFNGKADESEAEPVSVTAGSTTSGIDAAMVVGGQIVGKVTNAASKAGAEGIYVCAYERTGDVLSACAYTTSTGEYDLAPLVTGEYSVQFNSYANSYLPQYYSDKAYLSEATPVSVITGASTPGVDAAMVPAGKIAGTVTSASSGKPLEQIKVCAQAVNGGYAGDCGATNSSGEYTIAPLTTGEYTVEFSSGEGAYATQYYNGKATLATATPVLVSAGSTKVGIDAAMTPGGQITGKVTGKATTDGLQGIDVCAAEQGGEYITRCAATDSSGEYTIPNLSSGQYKVEFDPAGGAYFAQYYNDKSSPSEADPVSVTADATTSGIDAVMVAGGRITGKVTSAASHAALEGVSVCALQGEDYIFGSCAQASASGEYEISGLTTGSYKVEFYPENGANYLTQYYSDKFSITEATVLSVADEATTSGIDAAMTAGGEIAGRVTRAATKEALEGIQVCVYEGDDEVSGYGACAYTNTSGEYTIAGVPTGEYAIEFYAPDGNYLSQFYSASSSVSEATPVSVSAGAVTAGIDAAMRTGGQISGKVTEATNGSPLDDDLVCATPLQSGSSSGCVSTTTLGEYTIGDLPTGKYTVEFFTDGAHLGQYYNGKATFAEAEAVSVTAEATTSDVDAALSTKGTITGTVTGASTTGSSPLAGVEVCALQGELFGACASTGQNGEYTISGLSNGEYTVEFYPATGANYLTQYYNDKALSTEADTVTVSENATTSGIDATLQIGGEISGKVTFAITGDPLEGVEVCATESGGQQPEQCGSSTAAGEYTIVGLPSGEYTVEFDPRSGAYLAQYYSDKASPSEAEPVSVTAGAETPSIDAAMRGGEITGQVTEAATKGALEGIQVCAEGDGGIYGGCGVTNAAGEYTISGLASGEYEVEFYPGGNDNYLGQFYDDKATATEANPVSVSDDALTSGIDAAMVTGGKVTGTVTSESTPAGLEGIEVCAYALEGGEPAGCATTSASGEYTIEGLGTGEYTIDFYSYEAAAYVPQYYNGVGSATEATPVAVTAGATVAGIDATMLAKGVISGTVTNAVSKAPLGDIEVCASAEADDLFGTCSLTNSSGAYSIAGLETGEYELEFSAADGDYVTQYYEGRASSAEAARIPVTAGAVTPGIDAALTPTFTQVPVDITPPTISGATEEGQTLTEAHGAWSEDPTTYAYQWSRCDEAGEACAQIPAAKGEKYALVAGDVGHTIEVTETATNGLGAGAPATSMATNVVSVPEPLQARPGDDQTAVVGTPVQLDGADSRPLHGITSYSWSFGDGTSAVGATVSHTYAAAGEYQAKLTVTGPGGTTASATTTIDVIGKPGGGGLAITVRSGGVPIVGAQVLVQLAGGNRVEATTASEGVAHLDGLPDGSYEVSVYSSGYLPASAAATVSEGEGTGTIELTAGELAKAQVTDNAMTLTEIEAAGINPADPANRHVYAFQLHLNVGSPENTLSGYIGGGGFIAANGSTCSGWVCVWHDGEATIYTTVQGGEAPIISSLVVPFKASFLKEFYDVSLIVDNLAATPFTLKSGHATISLPSGLSLAPTSQPQGLTMDLPDIPGGGSATAHWILRGDTEGEYNLSATYSATLEPFERTITLIGRTATPIHVWGGSALKLTAEVDKQVQSGYPFHVRVGLTNVADVPVYDPAVELQSGSQAGYIQQPDQQDSYSTREIKPGETYWTGQFILVPDANGEVELAKSFIKKVAGDVTLDSTITTRERVPSLADNPQVKGHRRNEHTIALEWEPIPGASEYQIFRTTARTTEFPQTPDPNVIQVGATKAVITDAEETPSSYFAISSIVNGQHVMVHPLIASTEVTPGRYPQIRVTDETECGELHTHAAVTIEDPDFPLKAWSRTIAGVKAPQEALTGNSFHHEIEYDRAEGKLVPYTIAVEGEEPDAARADPGSASSISASAAGQLGYCQAAALGDSFSSGEGNPPFEAGTDGMQGENDCHRSIDSAYLKDLAEKDGREDIGMDDFVACSGAVTADFEHESQKNHGVGPQIETIPPETNLVTFSIGGNDLGFSNILEGCIADQVIHLSTEVLTKDPFADTPPCELAGAPYVESKLPGLLAHLKTLYESIKQKLDVTDSEPKPRIVVMGYPDIFPATAHFTLGTCSLIQGDDIAWMHEMIEQVNDEIEAMAHSVNVEFVNPNDGGKFTDHSVCSGDPYFNGVEGLDPLAGRSVQESFHPNSEGQKALSEELAAELRHAPSTSFTVRPNQHIASRVLVAAANTLLDVGITWPGSDVELRLTSPGGEVIDRDQVPAGVTHELGKTYESYAVPNAEVGEWTAEAVGLQVAEEGEPVTLDSILTPRVQHPPVALFTTSSTGEQAPLTVKFDASTSFDPEGMALTDEWNYGDGATATGQLSEHTYTQSGEYTPTLTVRTPDGRTDTFEGTPIVVGPPASTSGGGEGGGQGAGSSQQSGSGAGGNSASSGGQGSGGVLGFSSGGSSAVALVGPVTSRAGVVLVPLRCTATAGSCSQVTVRMTILEQLHKGRVVALTAGRGSTTKTTVLIGSATITLGAGQTKTLEVSLNPAGRKLLAQHKKLPAEVTIASSGHTLKTQIVSIAEAPRVAQKRR